MIAVLAVGDVVGEGGCAYLERRLRPLKKLYAADAVIVNGENAAPGNGLTRSAAERIFAAGADIVTSGNHIWRREEIYKALDENEFLLRPANYPASAPGKGLCVLDFGAERLAVINIAGTVYMDSLECPFAAADRLLRGIETAAVIVDFHAEATSEKAALARYLDGRVSAVFGTHTHVQTADERILPGGTGFISDVGMTGPLDSILGLRAEPVIRRFTTKLPVRFEAAQGDCGLSGALFEIDGRTGKCLSVTRVCVRD